jgi:NAD(P)-dependent dehydrogenase (short-subunit alcohol dehydrogenase family)
MSKHAIVGLTRQLACEYGPLGIRVNAICPGSIATDLRQNSMEILGGTAPEMSGAGVGALSPERLAQIVPLGARGTPEDVAAAATYLASAESDYMNGHTLVVDGGWTAR